MTWKVAYRNLFRNRRRTLATGTAILAGFVGLNLLGGYIIRAGTALAASTIYLNHHGHLTVFKKDAIEKFGALPNKYQISGDEKNKLKKVLEKFKEEIEFTTESLSGTGLISNGVKSVPFVATGIQAEFEDRIHEHPFVHKWAPDFYSPKNGNFAAAVARNPNSISITKELGELIGRIPPFSNLKADELSVQLAGRNYDRDLNAVNAELSVIHTTGINLAEETSIWAPIKLLQDLYGTEGIQYLAIYLKSEDSLKQVKVELENQLRLANLDMEVFPYYEERVSPMYVGTMSFLNVMAGFFIFLICGAVSLSIINSLTMGIFERSRELGTLRALGYRSSQISKIFAQEALLLTAASMTLGLILSALIVAYVNHANIRFSPPGVANEVQFILAPSILWITVVGGILVSISVSTGYVASRLKLKGKVIDLLGDSGA